MSLKNGSSYKIKDADIPLFVFKCKEEEKELERKDWEKKSNSRASK